MIIRQQGRSEKIDKVSGTSRGGENLKKTTSNDQNSKATYFKCQGIHNPKSGHATTMFQKFVEATS